MDFPNSSSLYASPVGPYVDGHIVPEKPEQLMKKYSAKHDLMFGLTHSEVEMSDLLICFNTCWKQIFHINPIPVPLPAFSCLF